MTPPSGNGSGTGDSAATQVTPALDRIAPIPSSGGGNVHGAGQTSPSQYRVAANTSSSGGGNGNAHSSGGVTLQEFRVALNDLHDAIIKVNAHRATVSDLLAQMSTVFHAAHDAWQSPSAATFETTATWFANSSHALKNLLDEMAHRMQATYDTYLAAETANTHNSGG